MYKFQCKRCGCITSEGSAPRVVYSIEQDDGVCELNKKRDDGGELTLDEKLIVAFSWNHSITCPICEESIKWWKDIDKG